MVDVQSEVLLASFGSGGIFISLLRTSTQVLKLSGTGTERGLLVIGSTVGCISTVGPFSISNCSCVGITWTIGSTNYINILFIPLRKILSLSTHLLNLHFISRLYLIWCSCTFHCWAFHDREFFVFIMGSIFNLQIIHLCSWGVEWNVLSKSVGL